MKKVNYTKSTKKMYLFIGIFIVFIFAGIFIIYAAEEVAFPYPTFISVFYVLFMGFLVLTFIRKSKDAKCPRCETDLYDVIDLAKNNGIKPSFCISCGQEIEI